MVTQLVKYLIETKLKDGASPAARSMGMELAKAGAAATAVAAGFAAVGKASYDMAERITGAVDRIHTLAANSGLAAETIRGLDAVAKSTGKEIKNLIPKDLPKRIAEAAEGSGDAVKGFDRLGVSVKNADGTLKSADVVLRETIDALAGVEDPTLKAAAAQEIFGARAQELTSALADSQDLDAWVQLSATYGQDIGPEAVRITAEWQQSTALMSLAVQKLQNDMLPLIDIMSNTVRGFAAMAAGAKGAAKGIFDPPGGLIGAIRGGWADIKKFAGEVNTLNKALDETSDAAKKAAAAARDFTDPNTVDALAASNKKAADAALEKLAREREAKAKEWARKRAKAVAEAEAEEYRRLGLGLLMAGPGETRTTLRMVSDVSDETAGLMAELDEAMQGVTAALEAAADEAAVPKGQGLADDITGVASIMADPLGAALGAVVGPVLAGPIGMLAAAALQLPSVIRSLTETIETLPETLLSIPDLMIGLADAIGRLPMELISMLPELLVAQLEAMMAFATLLPEIWLNIAYELFANLPGEFAEAIASAIEEVLGSLNPFEGNFLGFGVAGKGEGDIGRLNVPFFETGGEVARTGLAVVHEGEYVVPASQRARGGGMGGANFQVQITSNDPRIVADELRRATGLYGIGLSTSRGF